MKIFWRIIGLMVAAGVLMMVIGFATGGRTSLYYNGNGVFMDGLRSEPVTTADYNLAAFTDINVDVFAANVEFVESDRFGIELQSDSGAPITYTNINNRLEVRQESKRYGWRIGFGFSFLRNNIFDGNVRIYLPRDQKMGNIYLYSTAGRINANKLTADELEIKVTAGRIEGDQLETQKLKVQATSGDVQLGTIQAADCEFKLTSGRLEADDLRTGGLIVKMTSGDAKLDGAFSGTTDITMTSGNLTMDLKGRKQDYNRSVSMTSGDIRINGESGGGSERYDGAVKQLNLKLTSGNVRLNFSE